MKRRDFMFRSLLGAIGISLMGACTNLLNEKKKRVLRIAHITDMHIFPDASPEKGIQQLLEQLHTMKDKPDFVINTGDNIMDSLKRDKKDVASQWKVWKSYFRDNLQFDLYNCIGNHDVWGWGLDDEDIKNDPLYGKAWAMDMLELKNPYYSFEKNSWKIICLDSSSYKDNGRGYTAKIDDEQFEWLEKTLLNVATDMPVMIASHIPILSPSVFYDGDNEKTGNWEVPGPWMHIDSRRIKDLLKKYSNVKLAISGHVHLADQVRYLNVDYMCNGAVCGGWWKGPYQEFDPAYAVIDLYDDGSFENKLIPYEFKVEDK